MMKNPPQGQRIYQAFHEGRWSQLSAEQILDIREVLEREFKSIIKSLDVIIFDQKIEI